MGPRLTTRVLIPVAALVLVSVAVLEAQWAVSGSDINNTNTGNVGLGTTTPATKLHVVSASDDGNRIAQERSGGTQPPYTELAQRGWSSSHALLWAAYKTPNGSSVDGSLLTAGNTRYIAATGPNSYGPGGIIYNANGGTMYFVIGPESPGADQPVDWGTPPLTLRRNGNVGIGTTNPTARLHVSGNAAVTGNVTVSGNISAKYQDLAEWVPSRYTMPAATVVVLDPDRVNHVMPSQTAYDTRVAGVISSRPGVLLGEPGDGQVIVATTGRVRVQASAAAGAIDVGDLLVTSHEAGIAMRSAPVDVGGVAFHRPGTVLGKALEPLAEGHADILVLLSLQ